MRQHLDINRAGCDIHAMRTTLSIDDDLMAALKSLARSRSQSIGRVVSDLLRRGLAPADSHQVSVADDGFPLFRVPADAHIITLEDVKREDDEP